ncbi:SDR family oxidoreductase [Kitasatospora sp. NPDC004615]|uniref:SDR family oxidoreductase n=1 Tax=Kitasatospora sp. NPDC004615 TaxID=3364017 RepID=UPI00367B7079
MTTRDAQSECRQRRPRARTSIEIAATVAHLASPDARYVTGAVIAVDGGFSA